jgi:hypothetical protein
MGLKKAQEIIAPFWNVPTQLITSEIEGLYRHDVLAELGEIIKLYDVYDHGAQFTTEGNNGDYVPADLRFKQSAALINKQARFLFSKKPDIWVSVVHDPNNKAEVEQAKEMGTITQAYIDTVLKKTHFFSKLLKAAKDCFIGKRVACFVNFNEDTQKISIEFSPSLEFVYDFDEEDSSILNKIVCFYNVKESSEKTEQRIYKKKYWMDNGFCWIEEGIYDGVGNLIDELIAARPTKFEYIPAVVIINDGLTGEIRGQSDIETLADYESWYSRLNNADIDAERQGMNPIRYTIDMDADSTTGLSISAGSYWDLSSDQNMAQDRAGTVGTLETTMGYTSALSSTIERIKNNAYEQVEVPNISPENMSGMITSGKTLKAIYWGLIVRCDEKMLTWRPAIELVIRSLIDGALLYPKAAIPYTSEPIPDVEYDIIVDNQYPIPEDEVEEKTMDLSEVSAQVMSRKSYMKKWRNLTNDEVDAELQQIALEREMLEDSYSVLPTSGTSNSAQTEEEPEEEKSEEQKESTEDEEVEE